MRFPIIEETYILNHHESSDSIPNESEPYGFNSREISHRVNSQEESGNKKKSKPIKLKKKSNISPTTK